MNMNYGTYSIVFKAMMESSNYCILNNYNSGNNSEIDKSGSCAIALLIVGSFLFFVLALFYFCLKMMKCMLSM